MEPKLFDLVYQSVVRREPTYDGIYYTGVKTTGIVCRPSCRARTPKPHNVVFHRSLEEALEAGFRPCKRCKPEANGRLRPDAALAAQVDVLIAAQFNERLTLQVLASALAVSPFHLQRTYKSVTGRSPAEQLDEVRLARAKELLAHSAAIVEQVGKGVGFHSPSHFSSWFVRKTGISPSEYRNQPNGGGPH